MTTLGLPLPTDVVTQFCRRWKIRELALFGSVLRTDFRPDSDVDVLVTFTDDADWGLLVPCPAVRGAEGQGKRQGVLVRERLKDVWNEGAGRGTRTGSEVWYSRDERARDREVLHPQAGCA